MGPAGWTFRRAKIPGRPRELNLPGVERGSGGPKGQESLAQGLPWVLGLLVEALKGRPLTRRSGITFPKHGAPSGPSL